MALLLAAVNQATLQALMVPLMTAGIVAALYGGTCTILALRRPSEGEPANQSTRAFSLATALVFSLTLASILVASAALQEWLGNAGIVLAAALAGLVNTHSAAISVALLVASGKIAPSDAVLPILAGISTNSAVRMILSRTSGNRQFELRVMPGLILTVLAAWAGAYYVRING